MRAKRRRGKCPALALVTALCSPTLAWAQPTGEAVHNAAFCASVGGQTEVRHDYTYPGGQSYVLVDCETADTVYEAGLDTRASFDSVQQAIFASAITGKEPVVVLFDRDGVVGRYEHRIKTACEMVGIGFIRVGPDTPSQDLN